jgi:hypothetical protein
MGEYEVLVCLDSRIDFLPTPAEQHSASSHVEANLGTPLDLQALLSPRDAAESGALRMRSAFGMRIPREERKPVETNGHDEPPQPPHSNDRPFAVVEKARSAASPAPSAPANAVSAVGSAARMLPTSPAPAAAAPIAETAADNAPVADWALKTRQITRQELADLLAFLKASK